MLVSADKSSLRDDQKRLVITGWNHGFQKVEFTKMLRMKLGYSLSVAKSITDEVLAKHQVELVVPLNDFDQVFDLTRSLGAVAVDQKHEPDTVRNSWQ